MGHALRKEDQAQAEEKVTKYYIARKQGNTEDHIFLCKEEGGQLVFKLGCGIRYPVTRDMILNAISAGKGEWQGIRLGEETHRLRRAELRCALRELDKS